MHGALTRPPILPDSVYYPFYNYYLIMSQPVNFFTSRIPSLPPRRTRRSDIDVLNDMSNGSLVLPCRRSTALDYHYGVLDTSNSLCPQRAEQLVVFKLGGQSTDQDAGTNARTR